MLIAAAIILGPALLPLVLPLAPLALFLL